MESVSDTFDIEAILAGKPGTNREKLPSLLISILPLAVPILLIALGAVIDTLTKSGQITWTESTKPLHHLIAFLGDAQVALFFSALIAAWTVVVVRKCSRRGLERLLGTAIASAGTIILITSAGGAFGAALRSSGIGERITELVSGGDISVGSIYLILAFAVAAMIKTAQGSSTTAMITTAGIFSSMALNATMLGFHPAYLAVAIGSGAMVTGWMNDSGFCIFAGMSGVTETCALKTWTVGLVFLGLSALVAVLVLSTVLPLV